MEMKALYDLFRQFSSVQTDSRNLKKGDLFFALKGPNFNGNQFAGEALDTGAAYAVLDEAPDFQDDRVIIVDDVLQTLQHLAAYHRRQFAIPFIAITGSNGKTTTKELIHEVLSSQFKTYTTVGNLNNHIGVPLTILKIKNDAEMAVIEMGANHMGEIASYCEYAQPTHGLITNIGKAHLEGFGSAENVQKGKGELFDYLAKHGGVGFVNTDDPKVAELATKLAEKVPYGSHGTNATGNLAKSDPFIEVNIQNQSHFIISTNLVGSYNLPNVLAAVTTGRYFKVPDEKIKKAIEAYSPSNSRSQMLQRDSNRIILDAYNANPGSMKAAIENFAAMKGDKKILILGDMKELGSDSQKEHREIVALISKYKWDSVALTGPEFAAVNDRFDQFENSDATREWFLKQEMKDATILIKGSRSMKMEKVLG